MKQSLRERLKQPLKKDLKPSTKTWLKQTAWTAGLGLYYGLVSHPSQIDRVSTTYALPREITVIESSLPTVKRSVSHKGKSLEVTVLPTDTIDFSKPFSITTDRYRLIHSEDMMLSRMIGKILSVPKKIFFMDKNYAAGQDASRARTALSFLEQDKGIRDLTVRLNHNEAFYDFYRIFSEKHLRERNNLPARLLLGSLGAIVHEPLAELFRGSYYSPLSRTVVCYSNIEAFTAHEIGHHKDFSRFSSDWEYALARFLPPVTLYQEWVASTYARDALNADDKWQFNRFLLPAFGTYLAFSFGAIRQTIKNLKKKEPEEEMDAKKIKVSEALRSLTRQTARINAMFYTGLGAYTALVSQHPVVAYSAFAATMMGTSYVMNYVGRCVIPTPEEKKEELQEMIQSMGAKNEGLLRNRQLQEALRELTPRKKNYHDYL